MPYLSKNGKFRRVVSKIHQYRQFAKVFDFFETEHALSSVENSCL